MAATCNSPDASLKCSNILFHKWNCLVLDDPAPPSLQINPLNSVTPIPHHGWMDSVSPVQIGILTSIGAHACFTSCLPCWPDCTSAPVLVLLTPWRMGQLPSSLLQSSCISLCTGFKKDGCEFTLVVRLLSPVPQSLPSFYSLSAITCYVTV